MKIECAKDRLRDAVVQAERTTGRNLSLSILAFLYLEAKNGELIVRSTNLEIGIEIRIQAKVEKEGVVVVPGSILGGLLSGLGNEKKVTLEVIKENLSVSSSVTTSLIKSHPSDDFPTLPSLLDGEVFQIPAEVFLSGVQSVWYSASVSNIKPEISSVYIYQDNSDLVFAATDSFRLAEKRVKLKKPADFPPLLIPFRNIVEIGRVLENTSGEVEIRSNANQVSFSVDNVYITSRIVEGIFPDYKQIIPKEYKTEAIVLKQDLGNTIKITNIFSDKFHKVVLKVHPREKYFEVEARNADIGENSARITAALSGEDVDIGFNYRYIIDCFQSIKQDSISLEFNGAGKPLVMKGVGDSTFTYLVMPMNR